MTCDRNDELQAALQSVECPLCGHAKPEHQRACEECRSVLAAVAITETQAIADARRIRNWRQN